jgi:ketosteroid isomerase-like protein
MNDIAEKYFKLFSEKDLEGLDELFDADATLRDWEIEAIGKPNVFIAMKEIFDSVESINVQPVNMGSFVAGFTGKPVTVVAELDIVTNGLERLAVVDIIEFTDEGKILGIRAFKG